MTPRTLSRIGLWAVMGVFGGCALWVVIGVFGHREVEAQAATSSAAAVRSAPIVVAPDFAPANDSAPQSELTSLRGGDAQKVALDWANTAAAASGIPLRALLGYAGAALMVNAEQPGCHLNWTTLAAIGNVESGHGTHAGSSIAADGVTRPAIYGPLLDGTAYAAVPDTDGGQYDGNNLFDRAVGPLQFIPSTWEKWGADGNGDGVKDPQQIDDAALATARYLCHYGDLSNPTGWRDAVFAYNHVDSYVDGVAAMANTYSDRTG